jgi:hypothetical protein
MRKVNRILIHHSLWKQIIFSLSKAKDVGVVFAISCASSTKESVRLFNSTNWKKKHQKCFSNAEQEYPFFVLAFESVPKGLSMGQAQIFQNSSLPH